MLKEVRDNFLKFFEKKQHLIIDSAPLLSQNDKTILFVNSGMAPMKAYFLNDKTPPSKRIVTSQKCLRVGGKHNDLSEIGYTKRHHTFFEMLGNFSFGDYFKKEAIDFAWEFLIEELKLDKTKLYITIHPNDEEAKEYWLKHVSIDRITKLKSNIWVMGEIGPWGYCTEIFYDLEQGEGTLEKGDRYLEIWNIVFTQFCNDGKKNFDLDFPCIDTGIGLERITSIIEGKRDNYEIAFFKNPLRYLKIEEHNPHSKIFLDHLRSTSSLIIENVIPGPSQEGYVLRRLIRRMLRSFFTFKNLDFEETVKNIFELWKETYYFDANKVLPVFEKEKKSFKDTINCGLNKFEEIFQKNKSLSAEKIFLLHDTYGLTVDITYDLVREKEGTGDFSGFEKLMEEARQKNAKENKKLDYPETVFVEAFECEAELIGIEDDYLIFDKTVFYGEGGGQVGDTGEIFGQTFKARVTYTKKYRKVYCHEYELLEGKISTNQRVYQKLNKERRKKIEAHHSCSHLLQLALEKIYGNGIQQMGSYVSENKLREDFSFPGDIVNLHQVENEINRMIWEEKETEIRYMNLNEARKIGAKAFFAYEDKVRVVKVGDSLELCGGTHVKNTKDIIMCKILKVVAVKSGVKRFEAIAGLAYIEYLKEKESMFDSGCRLLNCQQQSNFLNELKKVIQGKIEARLEYSTEVNGIKLGVIIGSQEDKIDDLISRYKLDIACLYIEKDQKSNVKIRSKVSATKSAKDLISAIVPLFDAKGAGGNPELAQTGGKKQENLKRLFNKLKEQLNSS